MEDLRPPHDGSPVVDELRAARPATDTVGMEAARARAERTLFGASTPARLGRYLVVERIAGGGMGVVYRGYDPDLHRKVALKVLHPRAAGDGRAHARLLAEARALARLDHQHVVRVHDVLAESEQVVVVMELAEGETLAAWERSEQRSWRDVVGAYAQAARGLAAAHALGIVHRDFKPANAIIGADGRVRVLDFGLALAAGAAEQVPLATGSPEPGATVDGLTATGEIVGTLGYTSPEQLDGRVATQASDQFSLCVALHRALEGRPPFAGTDASSLLEAIRVGRIARATDGRTLPAWLRTVIARGLAADPAERHASIDALDHELTRARGWRRWRGPVVAVAVAAALGGLALRPRAAAGMPPCDGAARELDSIWNDAKRAALGAALTHTPGAGSLVIDGLDRYRARWIDLHRDACLAHRQGAQSDELLDRRMLCLSQRRADLSASVDVLSRIDDATAGKAVDVVAGLPRVDDCADLESLTAAVPPPSAPAQRSQVAGVRATLGRAAALDRSGRTEEALAVAVAAQTEARRAGYKPAMAEAALARGTLLLHLQRNKDAAPVLLEARSIALRDAKLTPLAVEAAARQLYVEQMELSNKAVLERDISIFAPMSEGIFGNHLARPLLLNNIGTAFMAAGDRKAAADYFGAARAARPPALADNLELMIIDSNLAMVTADPVLRERETRRVWQHRATKLGASHVMTLWSMDAHARTISDPRTALDLMVRVCMAYDTGHGTLVGQRMYCKGYVAFLKEYLGDVVGAQAEYREIRRTGDGESEPREADIQAWTMLASGHELRLAGELTDAAAYFQRLFDMERHSSDHWIRIRAAHAACGLAAVDPGSSREELLRFALDAYKKQQEVSYEAELVLRIAGVRALSASLLKKEL